MEDYTVVKQSVEGEVIPQGVSITETDISVNWHIRYGKQAFYIRYRKDDSLPPRLEVARWTKSSHSYPDNPVEDGWILSIDEIHERLLELESIKKDWKWFSYRHEQDVLTKTLNK